MSCILPPNAGVEPGHLWFRVCGHGRTAACSEKKHQVNAAVAKMLMVMLGCPCPRLLPAADLCGSLSPSPELLGRGEMHQGTPPHTTTAFSCSVLLSSVHKSTAVAQGRLLHARRRGLPRCFCPQGPARTDSMARKTEVVSRRAICFSLCYATLNINNKVCGHCRGQRARC